MVIPYTGEGLATLGVMGKSKVVWDPGRENVKNLGTGKNGSRSYPTEDRRLLKPAEKGT